MDLNNVEFTWIKNKHETWKTHRVKNHFILTKNKTEEPEGHPILSLTMKGIVERDISSNEGQLPETYKGYNLLDKNDVVFNPMDLISGWVDCSPLVGLISPSYKVLRPISDKVNIRFYTYYFQTHYTEKIFFQFGEGVHYEYRWGLGTETLRNFPLVVPPITEQQQIVSFLNTKNSLIDLLVEKTQQKIELLKENKISVINEVVTNGLNPNVEKKDSGVEWIGDVPKHWDLVKPYGLFRPVKRNPDENDEIITCFRDGQVTLRKNRRVDGFTVSLKEIGYQKVLKGDLVVHQMDGFEGSIGVSDSEGKSSPVLTVIPKSNRYNNFYWMYLLRRMSKTGFIESLSKSIRERTTEFRWNMWKGLLFCHPPVLEQDQIVEYLNEQTQKIDKTISIEQKRIELLKEYRQSLNSELVTGKRKVSTYE